MRKLDVKICKCGRIHFYSTELLDRLLEDGKELVLICSKCGDVMHIGADKEPACYYDEEAEHGKYVFNMYSYTQKNEIIDADSFDVKKMKEQGKSPIGKILIDEGIGVMMETGYYATACFNGFQDLDSWFNVEKNYQSVEELLKEKEAYDEKRSKVVMPDLIKRLTDEQAEALSGYYIEGLDWTGTKWERWK